MDMNILFNCLKILWIGFQLWQHKRKAEREKALVSSLENLNQRLSNLESEIKKLKS